MSRINRARSTTAEVYKDGNSDHDLSIWFVKRLRLAGVSMSIAACVTLISSTFGGVSVRYAWVGS